MYDACVMRGAVVFGSDCVFQFTRGRELSFQLKGRAFKGAAVRKKKKAPAEDWRIVLHGECE